MKKLYLGLAIALLFTVLPTKENIAQDVCPVGPQKVFSVNGFVNGTGKKIVMVYIEGFQPLAHISLFDVNKSALGVSGNFVTDANGNGYINYDPTVISPVYVGICSGLGCCRQPIPAATTCAANVQNVVYPAIPPVPQVCCIYLSKSVAGGDVRVFDGNQNLIPTVSRTDAVTDATGASCYVYDCNSTPFIIATCGPSGCCSNQVGAAGALPISLISFNAILNSNKKAQLNWSSSFEIGANKFIVERSDDGTHFSGVSEVRSAGNSAYVRNYTFTDPTYAAFAFYRLKMVDIDGQIAYSKVVYVNNKNGAGIVSRIFPNPFTSEIQLIGINSADLNNKNVRLYNASGQQMAFRVSGANAISLDANAPVGVYILAVKDQRFKIIKQN